MSNVVQNQSAEIDSPEASVSGLALVKNSAHIDLWLVHWSAEGPPDQLGGLLSDHLRYMVELEERGVLFASGPLADVDGVRAGAGLTALRVADEAQARMLADQDPYAKAGLRSYTLQRWSLVEGKLTVSVRLSNSSVEFGLPRAE